MLRYYEQNGLIQSMRIEGYSYRVYDEANLKRLQQVIILRKLQIPIKQICIILNNPNTATVVEIFKNGIKELDSEITALSTIKLILDNFVKEIERIVSLDLNLDFINGDSVLELASSLSLIKKNIKANLGEDCNTEHGASPLASEANERVGTLSNLLKSADVLNKLDNVRVVYMPPMTVASVYCQGENSEEKAWQAITDFIKENNLIESKPDLRVFKIAHQNATGEYYGDEVWVSIPEAFTVPSTFTKKRFNGGQYAAHALDNNGFEVALGLQDWINESNRYQYDNDDNLSRCDPPINETHSLGGMHLDLLEVLNFNNFQKPNFEIQIDFMTPVKDYVLSEEILKEIPGSKEKCGYKARIVTKNKFRIMGFTTVMSGGVSIDGFIEEIEKDARMDIVNKFRKPGAPILGFSSHDLDSQIRGGWRFTICLAEPDITNTQVFMKHNPYIEKIDASRWLIFEYTRKDAFDSHTACQMLGYTWNGVVSGSFMAFPNDTIKAVPSSFTDMNSIIYCWYPIK